MTFQLSLEMAAPPATMFDFVADLTTVPTWYSAVQRIERTGKGLSLPTMASAVIVLRSDCSLPGRRWPNSPLPAQ
jgi:hypothetical protein